MTADSRFALLDRPEILQFTFYPRKETRKGPPNSSDYLVPVGDGFFVGCRFYVDSYSAPSLLFFHGNGEIASDYDVIAPVYNERGLNLFVADYRGYGSSSGTPTFVSMVDDAHAVFRVFLDTLHSGHYTGDVFVMGRSLGSIPAIELAAHYPKQIRGLIIESGLASMPRLLKHLGFPAELLAIDDDSFPNAANVRSITMPTLILHGEFDSLIPVTEAHDLWANSAAKRKPLVIINGAEHNDIMLVGFERYFAEITDFIFG